MTKRMKWTRLIPVAAVALAGAACNDGWGDLTGINENRNAPTVARPELIFTEGIQQAAGDLLGNAFNMDYGEHLAQHFAEIAYAEEDRYLYRPNEIDNLFRLAYYEYLKDFQEVIDLGEEAGNDNIVAGGLIMKTWAFHQLTDIWGDLPYSEALKGDAEEPIFAPKYDTQEEIYNRMLADLANASEIINPSGNPFGGQDLIYKGDMAKWQKFANSLRLRLAMRISDVDPEKARAEFNAALAAPGGIFTSNADNALMCYGTVTRNPWHTYFQSRGNDYRISATLIDTLKAFNDPRLPVYASPIASDTINKTYIGMPNGRADGHGIKPGDVSRPGSYFLSQTACHALMTYSEVLFLQAEAVERGFITGNAADFYEAAIRASMERWDIPADTIDTYLAQPRVQYGAGTWKEQIGLQKWLSLFGQGLEAFAEVRRLDQPQLKPGPDAQLEHIPLRYPYPFSEEQFNKANLLEAMDRQGISGSQHSQHATPVWWDVNPPYVP